MRKRRKTLLVSFIAFAFAVNAQQYDAPPNATQFQNQAASLLLNGEYHEAIDALKISASFYKEAQQWPHYFSCLNQITNAYLSLEDFDEAKAMAKEALWSSISNLGRNNNEAAKAAHQLAEVYSQAGRYKDATQFHEMALKIRAAIFSNPNPSIADSYRQMGKNLNRAGQFQDAYDYYQQALSILNQLYGEKNEAVANVYTHIGHLYHDQNNISAAIKSHQKALDINTNLFGEDDIKVAPSLVFLSELYKSQQQEKKALPLMKQAANIFLPAAEESSLIAANCLHTYSNHLLTKGNCKEALPYAQKASSLFLQHGNKKATATAHYNYGRLLIDQYEIQKATSILKRASIAANPPPSTYKLLSIALAEMGQLAEAISYAEKYEKSASNTTQQVAAKILKADLLTRNGQLPYASDIIDQSIALSQSDALLKEAYLLKAKNLFQQKEYEEVLSYCDKSISSSAFSTSKDQLLQLEALIFKSISTFKLSQQGKNKIHFLTTSHTGFQEAHTILEALLLQPLSNRTLVSVNQLSNKLIKHALDCSYELFQQTQDSAVLMSAFSFIEKGKATSLAIRFRIQEPFLSDWTSLDHARWNTVGLTAQIEEAHLANIATSDYLELWNQYKQEYQSASKKMSAQHPSIYQLGYSPEIVSGEALQRILGQENQVALSYYVSENALYVVVAKSDNIELFRHEITPTLDQRIKQFYLLCSTSPNEISADALATSFVLYKELSQQLSPILTPIDQYTDNSSQASTSIVFFPHGPLHLFPFDALSLGDADISNFGDVPYLGRLMMTNYHYSATTYLNTPNFTPPKSFIGIFPKEQNSTQLSIAKPISSTDASTPLLDYLLPLANRMVGELGGSIFTHSAQLDITNEEDKARFLMLGLPFQAPALLLSNNDYESRNEIGWLNLFAPLGKSDAADIFMFPSNRMNKLEAGGNWGLHLAILSKDHHLLMNRNIAEENSVSYFIDELTANLFKGSTPSKVLLEARLSYLEHQSNQPLFAHPYYWSGYCFIGKDFNGQHKDGTGTPYWIFAIIGLLIFISLWVKRN